MRKEQNESTGREQERVVKERKGGGGSTENREQKGSRAGVSTDLMYIST